MPYYIVKADNVSFPGNLSNPQVILANSGPELLSNILQKYNMMDHALKDFSIEIWSKPLGFTRIRLDTLNNIPTQYDQAWIRLVRKRSENHLDLQMNDTTDVQMF